MSEMECKPRTPSPNAKAKDCGCLRRDVIQAGGEELRRCRKHRRAQEPVVVVC